MFIMSNLSCQVLRTSPSGVTTSLCATMCSCLQMFNQRLSLRFQPTVLDVSKSSTNVCFTFPANVLLTCPSPRPTFIFRVQLVFLFLRFQLCNVALGETWNRFKDNEKLDTIQQTHVHGFSKFDRADGKHTWRLWTRVARKPVRNACCCRWAGRCPSRCR